MTWPYWSLAVALLVACGSRPERKDPPPGEVRHDAGPPDAVANRGPGVWLRVIPGDAGVEIDGEPIGTAADITASGGFVSLPAGLHQIVVRREGYETWRAEVTVREDTEPIDIVLEPL